MSATTANTRPLAWLLTLLLGVTLATDGDAARRRRGGPRKVGPWVVGRVLQVTTAQVFVDLGSRFGLRAGDQVLVRFPDRHEVAFALTAVSRTRGVATLPAGADLPLAGSPARAHWRPLPAVVSQPRAVRLEPPEPLPRLAEKWRGVSRARSQRITYHAKPTRRDRRRPLGVRGAFRLEYLGLLNLGGDLPRDYHELGFSSSLEVPRLLVDWLDYAHDLRARLYLSHDLDARPFSRSRSALLVRRLRFGLNLPRFSARLGRHVGAPLAEATTVDGSSARASLLPWLHVGAFGGLLPRADDLRPDTQGTHFGGYTSLRFGGDDGWSLNADAGFLGSTWDGAMDRRAISGQATLDTERLSLATSAVVDLFGTAHPSGLSGATLTSLSALAEGKLAPGLRLGTRFDRYRFVPSREALATFPTDFVAEGGAVSSLRGYADLELGARAALSAQGGWDRRDAESQAGWGELLLRLSGLWRADQLQLSGSTSHGELLSSYGGRVAYLRPISEQLSLTLDYALHRERYAAFADAVWRHDGAIGGELTVLRHWLLAAEARIIASEEERLLQALATLGYQL